ncbi:MAG: S8 family serine peptidase, partial [Candidatus Thermoplasmatota archaeon]|nr:S8 family serine peptidase [Candidatus Thermoplasmatota archaeon]
MRRAALLVLLFLVPTVQGAILPEAPATQALLDVDTVPLSQLEAGALQRVGFEILESFPVSTTVLVTGPATGLDALEALWFVKAVVQDSPVEPMLSSSRAAAGLPPALTEAGLTGEGVTIALVDAGLDQDHPALADRVLADMAVSEDGIKPDAPTSSEHGTHVGGILVGTGYGSEQGSLAGVASGANLVNMDLSKQFTTSNALRAFQWIYDNHEAYNIQVVANSWGR